MKPPWHPRQDLRPTEYLYNLPGTTRPYAIIRLVEVRAGEQRVMRWRAVTYEEPRVLIGEGYWPGLDTCVEVVHRFAVREGAHAPDIRSVHPDAHGRPPGGGR
ncbi:hypothetical protein DVJ78_07420 [Humibacter sp. BT305]|nr:hypothetical protein DVJ78_07420 [Humibacter sp. BT305]